MMKRKKRKERILESSNLAIGLGIRRREKTPKTESGELDEVQKRGKVKLTMLALLDIAPVPFCFFSRVQCHLFL